MTRRCMVYIPSALLWLCWATFVECFSASSSSSWSDLIDAHICRALEREVVVYKHYVEELGTPDWSLDMDGDQTLHWGSSVQYSVQVLGSWSTNSNTFLWAWANPHVGNDISCVDLKHHASLREFDIFRESQPIPVTEQHNGQFFSYVAESLLPQSKGIWLAEYENGLMYLLLTDPNFPTDERPACRRLTSVLEQAIQQQKQPKTLGPLIVNQRLAFCAYAESLGLQVEQSKRGDRQVNALDLITGDTVAAVFDPNDDQLVNIMARYGGGNNNNQ